MASPLKRMNLSRARILVVEDNPHSMEIISQMLLGFGVSRARLCGSPAEGAAILGAEHFDLLLVDHDMPGQDGLEFCRTLRADPQGPNFTTPLILLTGLPSHATVQAVRNAGANFVLVKPLAAGVLLDRIEWLSRETRPFVCAPGYCGPDRRFVSGPPPPGVHERREDQLSLIASPDREMSQNEINALFG